jgi:2-oxoglutarate ferredoxin oxidoreductase subunit delta
MARGDKVQIENPDWCKQCGICVSVCPTDVLKLGDNGIEIINLNSCIGCEQCALICPDFVLKVVANDD